MTLKLRYLKYETTSKLAGNIDIYQLFPVIWCAGSATAIFNECAMLIFTIKAHISVNAKICFYHG